MQRRVGALVLSAFVFAPGHVAVAAGLPEILASPRNAVPECVTPGRLMQYLKSRNPDLNSRFESVATEYMRHGEQLNLRWDYAFYQMIIETGSLSFRRGHRAGDVKPVQNNFAGLGATGGGESGESFSDISAGVRAHLEHVLLYAGKPVDNPIAERTRKVQEWGVLTSWHQAFKRPITFSDLAAKWAPHTSNYSKMLEAIAEKFNDDFCQRPDPQPELVAEARGQRGKGADIKTGDISPERPSGAELARRAIDEGRSQGGAQMSALGGQNSAKPQVPYKVLNNPPPEAPAPGPAAAAETAPPDAPAKVKKAAAATVLPSTTPPDKAPLRTAAAPGAAKSLVETAPAGRKCRVWTASYGGQKAMIIKSVMAEVINYTVLDVNEGAEAREASAFIAAYAKDGTIAGEFPSQAQALDKAFELCPEG